MSDSPPQLLLSICCPVTQPWPTLFNPMHYIHQASLSLTISQNLLKFIMSIALVMPSNHLILCCPLLLLPSIFSSIRVFSSELGLYIRWPKYWSFSVSLSPSKEYAVLIFFKIDWFYLRSSRIFSSFTVQKLQFFKSQPSLRSNSHIHT